MTRIPSARDGSDVIDVLLVEDNAGDAELIGELLAEPGCRITVARDGLEATRKLEDEALEVPDFVILDLNLPRKDGRSVLVDMRASSRTASVPVVVLSSSEATTDIAAAYSLGANCYVVKPFGLAELERTVRAIGMFWGRVARLPPVS